MSPPRRRRLRRDVRLGGRAQLALGDLEGARRLLHPALTLGRGVAAHLGDRGVELCLRLAHDDPAGVDEAHRALTQRKLLLLLVDFGPASVLLAKKPHGVTSSLLTY